MSISKRSMGVAGFKSDPRPDLTLKEFLEVTPKEIGIGRQFNNYFKLIEVKEEKSTFTCIYHGQINEVILKIKKIRIEEAADRKKYIKEQFDDFMQNL